jgi:hypothetical protein
LDVGLFCAQHIEHVAHRIKHVVSFEHMGDAFAGTDAGDLETLTFGRSHLGDVKKKSRDVVCVIL